jgi:hypothetical protein
MEGVKCMIYGRPEKISSDKAALYFTYAPKSLKEAASLTEDRKLQYEIVDDENGEQLQKNMEQIVNEFNVVKQVLLNNSIPVDMSEMNNLKRKGWGTRILFDKKTFHSLLVDLERMRKVLNLKKSFYIFHIPYEGKP